MVSHAAEIHVHFDPGAPLRCTPGYQYAAPLELKQPCSVISELCPNFFWGINSERKEFKFLEKRRIHFYKP
jgi:hypothetical protein